MGDADLERRASAGLDHRRQRAGLHHEARALELDRQLDLRRRQLGQRARIVGGRLRAPREPIHHHVHVLDERGLDRQLDDRRRPRQLHALLRDQALPCERDDGGRGHDARPDLELRDVTGPVRRPIGDDLEVLLGLAGRPPWQHVLRAVAATAAIHDAGGREVGGLIVLAREPAGHRRGATRQGAAVRVDDLGVVAEPLRAERARKLEGDLDARHGLAIDIGHDRVDGLAILRLLAHPDVVRARVHEDRARARADVLAIDVGHRRVDLEDRGPAHRQRGDAEHGRRRRRARQLGHAIRGDAPTEAAVGVPVVEPRPRRRWIEVKHGPARRHEARGLEPRRPRDVRAGQAAAGVVLRLGVHLDLLAQVERGRAAVGDVVLERDRVRGGAELLHADRVAEGRRARRELEGGRPEVHVRGQCRLQIEAAVRRQRRVAARDAIAARIAQRPRDGLAGGGQRDVGVDPVVRPADPALQVHGLAGLVGEAIVGDVPARVAGADRLLVAVDRDERRVLPRGHGDERVVIELAGLPRRGRQELDGRVAAGVGGQRGAGAVIVDEERHRRVRDRREERGGGDVLHPRADLLLVDARGEAELGDLDPRALPRIEVVGLAVRRRGRDLRDHVADAGGRQGRAQIDAQRGAVGAPDLVGLVEHALAGRRPLARSVLVGEEREVVVGPHLVEAHAQVGHRLRVDDPLRDLEPRIEHDQAGGGKHVRSPLGGGGRERGPPGSDEWLSVYVEEAVTDRDHVRAADGVWRVDPDLAAARLVVRERLAVELQLLGAIRRALDRVREHDAAVAPRRAPHAGHARRVIPVAREASHGERGHDLELLARRLRRQPRSLRRRRALGEGDARLAALRPRCRWREDDVVLAEQRVGARGIEPERRILGPRFLCGREIDRPPRERALAGGDRQVRQDRRGIDRLIERDDDRAIRAYLPRIHARQRDRRRLERAGHRRRERRAIDRADARGHRHGVRGRLREARRRRRERQHARVEPAPGPRYRRRELGGRRLLLADPRHRDHRLREPDPDRRLRSDLVDRRDLRRRQRPRRRLAGRGRRIRDGTPGRYGECDRLHRSRARRRQRRGAQRRRGRVRRAHVGQRLEPREELRGRGGVERRRGDRGSVLRRGIGQREVQRAAITIAHDRDLGAAGRGECGRCGRGRHGRRGYRRGGRDGGRASTPRDRGRRRGPDTDQIVDRGAPHRSTDTGADASVPGQRSSAPAAPHAVRTARSRAISMYLESVRRGELAGVPLV